MATRQFTGKLGTNVSKLGGFKLGITASLIFSAADSGRGVDSGVLTLVRSLSESGTGQDVARLTTTARYFTSKLGISFSKLGSIKLGITVGAELFASDAGAGSNVGLPGVQDVIGLILGKGLAGGPVNGPTVLIANQRS